MATAVAARQPKAKDLAAAVAAADAEADRIMQLWIGVHHHRQGQDLYPFIAAAVASPPGEKP